MENPKQGLLPAQPFQVHVNADPPYAEASHGQGQRGQEIDENADDGGIVTSLSPAQNS
jgi:hypothetical protein